MSLWIDEAYSITIAQAILRYGYPLLPSGELIWRSPLYHYGLALMWWLGHGNSLVLRSFSILGFGLAVLAVGLCARDWFGKRIGWIVSGLMILSGWELSWSYQIRMYSWFQAWFWLTLWSYQRWRQGRLAGCVPLMLGLVTLGTHGLGVWLVPLIICYEIVQRKTLNLWFYAGVVVILVVSWVVGLNLVGYTVPVNYFSHYLLFLLLQHGLVVVVGLIGLHRKRLGLWLVGSWWVILGIVSFGIPLLHYRYLFVVYPMLLLGVAIILAKWRYVFAIPLVVLVLVWQGSPTQLESDPPQMNWNYSSFTPQPDFDAIYNYIKQQPSAVVISPYPAMTQLYLHQAEPLALYIDLTGTVAKPPSGRELYTGVPYATSRTLTNQFKQQPGFVILDVLGKERMQPELLKQINASCQVVQQSVVGSWNDWSLLYCKL